MPARAARSSDNSSALTHEIKRSRGRALNDNYAELLDHYGLEATLNSGQCLLGGSATLATLVRREAVSVTTILLQGSP